jgi:hypothetical protein
MIPKVSKKPTLRDFVVHNPTLKDCPKAKMPVNRPTLYGIAPPASVNKGIVSQGRYCIINPEECDNVIIQDDIIIGRISWQK